jgi:hypothetical protein
MRLFYGLVCAMLVAATAPASAQLRSLNVPNDKGWQHAQTGLILMARLGEFQRTDLADNGTSELDVAATYQIGGEASTASVYLYRPGIDDLPMWFDRSLYLMGVNDRIQVGAPIGAITRFALPGSNIESGLRSVYTLNNNPEGATGLAIAPLGAWLVAIRLTSQRMNPTKLDATLAALMTKIRWPGDRTAPKTAIPIAPCASAIKYKRAKLIKPDLTQVLLSAALLATTAKSAKSAQPSKPVIYCRADAASSDFTTYRANESRNSYVMAIGDAGIAVQVMPAISLSKDSSFSVVLKTLSSSDIYPNYNALPDPKQVFALLGSASPMSRAGRGQQDITLSYSPSK